LLEDDAASASAATELLVLFDTGYLSVPLFLNVIRIKDIAALL
jgi:hypothetical protein